MGLMIDGAYLVDDPAPKTAEDGAFQRAKSSIRNWITPTGDAGPTGVGGYHPDPKRYHLFVAWNCPWAHRTLLMRGVLGLEQSISISIAKPRRTDQGWVFDAEGEFTDPLFDAQAVHEIYSKVSPSYTGRITVPVLWDKQSNTAVSNESADIVRMLGQNFGPDQGFYPDAQRPEIDRWNDLIYQTVNNGVYRAGFAGTQEAYQSAAVAVFETLDLIERQLGETRYLCGDGLTEADIRLFPTLARFDVAYFTAFKCNLRRLIDYPNLAPRRFEWIR